MKILTPFILVLICLFGFEHAKACSCVGLQPCEAFSYADTVFVGTVISTRKETAKVQFAKDEAAFPHQYQISLFKVEETFLGENSKQVSVITDLSTSCSWELKKGSKYLIYGKAANAKNTFSTGYCSRSTELQGAEKDLEYLRSLPKTLKGSVISGSVFYSRTGKWINPLKDVTKERYKQLLNLGITNVKLQSNSLTFETKINEDGTYQFIDIPKGNYRLQPIMSAEHTTGYWKEYREIEAIGHGCNLVNFTVIENGMITGKITDSQGNPVKGISISLIPTNSDVGYEYYEADRFSALTVKTDENGIYNFKGILTGSYLVATRGGEYIQTDSIDAAYPRIFFPSVTKQEQATPVQITKGKLTANIDFFLPLKFSETIVKGRVFFKNGRPAPKVFVRYIARTPDKRKNSIVFIKTDENGYFSFTGYENHHYLIGAFTDERQGNKPTFAIEQEIVVNGSISELKFVLNRTDSENCKECRNYLDFPTETNKQ